MHHTDYSQNRRNTPHNKLKNLFTAAMSSDSTDAAAKDLWYAAVAAMLVLLSLFQMDPANAELEHNADEQHVSVPLAMRTPEATRVNSSNAHAALRQNAIMRE